MSTNSQRYIAQMKPLLILTIGALACVPLAVWASTAPEQQQPPPWTTVIPNDMILPLSKFQSTVSAVRSDLKRTTFSWNTLGKTVSITRLSRPDKASAWTESEQELSSSFWITDVRSVCSSNYNLSLLYVLGMNSGGGSIIERWGFSYLNNGLIRVARHELLNTSSWGTVRSIEADPEGRFVLFLNRDAPTVGTKLYRLDLPTGTVTCELDSVNVPLLATAKSILVQQHATEGRQYHLYSYTRWLAGGDQDDDVLFLRDGDNDGVFDSPAEVTIADWGVAGYDQVASWVDFCP